MTTKPSDIRETIAPLKNVALFTELVERVMKRPRGLPGMGAFTGFSGYGKSVAAIYAANKFRAYHVQVKSVWSRKKLCGAILHEMGIDAGATLPDMVDQIGQQVALSGRPLIVDEADFLLAKGMIEVIRDIYESSRGTIILIGEEQLPQKLRRFERVHGRMLDWVQAQPCALADAKHLVRLYCSGIEVDDALLEELHRVALGSVRRLCINLARVREHADATGARKVKEFPGEIFTGTPPAQRRAA